MFVSDIISYRIISSRNKYVVRRSASETKRSADDRTVAHPPTSPFCATLYCKVSKPSLNLNEGPTPRHERKQHTRQQPASPALSLVDCDRSISLVSPSSHSAP
ncbi:unnamed protein product, partial [Ectocarpus sp. 8 AP-2014]